MFTKIYKIYLNKRIFRIKILLLGLFALFFSGGHFLINDSLSDPVIHNDVEDLNILISQFVGSQPNALIILDLSGSTGLSYGGTELASWDKETTVDVCEAHRFNRDKPQRFIVSSHCAEKTAGTSVCSSIVCEDAECDLQVEFDNLIACVQVEAPTYDMSPIFDDICGNSDASSCNNNAERWHASAAIEAGAGLTQCMTLQCSQDADPSCNREDEYDDFKDCMLTSQAITANKNVACTGGTPDCEGVPGRGTSRLDMTLNSIFSFLDADNSLATKNCDDPGKLFDGVSTSISCKDYMETPFRNVSPHVLGGTELPITGAADTPLLDELTANDAKLLGIRFRAMSYSGFNGVQCSNPIMFRVSPDGFEGGSKQALDSVWEFYRGKESRGGTPLALSLGFDDNNSSSTGTINDALGAYRVELQTDPAISCRQEFVIVITDGEDRCSNKPSGGSTNMNRRSSVQAVSNLRTYYARNPVSNSGNTYKKEILTFVIGIGIVHPEGVRALNAMALAGGTHTTGILKHLDPNGNLVPGVDPPGGLAQVFKDLGMAKGLETNPTNATLKGCLSASNNRDSDATCRFQGQDIFDNNFFKNGTGGAPFDSLNTFAFFANSPEELLNALQSISTAVESFSVSGSSPAAPASSTAVFLRDRIYLTVLQPRLAEPIWQGRLALYGFVDDPANPGGKVIVRKPNPGEDLSDAATVEALNIFDNTGGLGINAQEYFWEAGKKLAERDLLGDERKIFTIKFDPDPPDPTMINSAELDTSSEGLRFIGERIPFSDQLFPTVITALTPEHFSISDADVDPDGDLAIPALCTSNCPSGVGEACELGVTDQTCKTCVKDCLRDEIVRFFSGATGIIPSADALGEPDFGSCPADTEKDVIGCDCFDLDVNPSGGFENCSVRLGDLFHSAPVVVSSPNPFFFDTGFSNFVNRFIRRTSALYIGSNSGAIHAFHAGELQENTPSDQTVLPATNPFTNEDEFIPFFDEGSGREMFAFIPGFFLTDSRSPNLTDPTSPPSTYFNNLSPAPVPLNDTPEYRFGDFKNTVLYERKQRSYVDGSFLIADVWIDGYSNGIKGNSSCEVGSGTSTADADGSIDFCGKEWHTVLLTGNRNGGGFYTALDVTAAKCSTDDCDTSSANAIDNGEDIRLESATQEIQNPPQYPRHLWTLYDKHFGNTWSKPTIGRVRMQTKDTDGDDITVDRWIMFVGGGVDPVNFVPNKDSDLDGEIDGIDLDDNLNYLGNGFYAMDIATGKTIFKFHPSNNSLANTNLMACEVASEVGVFDLNTDGYVDIAYVGDTCGRMWRFDVSMPIETGSGVQVDDSDIGIKGANPDITAPNWTGSIAFCASSNANCLTDPLDEFSDPIVVTTDASIVPSVFPIYFPPSVVLDDQGRKHVIFVTGDEREPSSTDKFGKLYNFIDDFIPAFLAGGTAITASKVKTDQLLTDAGLVITLSSQGGVADQFTASVNDQTKIDAANEFIVVFPLSNESVDSDADLIDDTPGGEKGVGRPIVANRLLIFATFAPDELLVNSCFSGPGVGRIFVLDYLTGRPALARIPGSEGLLAGQSDSEKAAAAGRNVGAGKPTPASLTFGKGGSLVMTVAFSGASSGDSGGSQFLVLEIADFPQRTQTLYWEEII